MVGSPTDWFSTAETTLEGGDGAVPAPLAAGDRLGRYVLELPLGEGAMGQVWRARDPQLDRAVAIKVVHPTIARSREGAARLLREARAMAKLSHPNVIAVHDAGQDGDRLFVAMDLVEGLTLGDALRGADPARPRDWRRTLALYVEAGRGLAAAHGAGILHRDFKPDNVLVDRSGRVCVGDFGLAAFGGGGLVVTRRPLTGEVVLADVKTAAGAVVGTPAYMSPEQLGGGVIDARADQFAFCTALYEALYGEHPRFAELPLTVGALVVAMGDGAIRPPPRPDPVPRWLRAAVVRGLAADPAARWPDMNALLAALVRPAVPPLLVGAAALAVIAAVLAAIVVVRARREPAPAAPAPAPTTAAVRRFDVSMATRIALSPDGRRLAMATLDRLDVRDLESGRVWSRHAPAGTPITRVQFDGPDRVLFARPSPLRLDVFDLARDEVSPVWADVPWGMWLGRLAAGDVVANQVGGGWDLALLAPGGGAAGPSGIRTLGGLGRPTQQTAISPDGTRVALIDEGRYDGRIVVLDRDGLVARSAPLPALTAVAWKSDAELVYATGTVDTPTLFTAPLAAGAIGPGRVLHRAERGWFGQLATGGGRLVFVDSGATFRSRVIDRGPGAPSARDLDTGTVGAVLGWLDDGTFLAWNRGTGLLERHDDRGLVAATPARLDGESANATRAGDVVIASLRRDAGRELVAVSIADGRERWRRAPGQARAVRCAGDRRPPCFVFADGGGDERLVRPIDPETGVAGAPLPIAGRIDDLAVADDGGALLVSDGSSTLRRVELASGAVAPVDATVATRGVAFDPRGGVLIAGTAGNNRYLVVRVDGAAREVLLHSRNEILYVPRASPDRDAVLVMGRLFLPAIFELPLAR